MFLESTGNSKTNSVGFQKPFVPTLHTQNEN